MTEGQHLSATTRYTFFAPLLCLRYVTEISIRMLRKDPTLPSSRLLCNYRQQHTSTNLKDSVCPCISAMQQHRLSFSLVLLDLSWMFRGHYHHMKKKLLLDATGFCRYTSRESNNVVVALLVVLNLSWTLLHAHVERLKLHLRR